YGEQTGPPADETHPCRPRSPYAVAKLAVEHYLDYFRATFGLEAVVLRYANVYGPRQDPHGEAGVVAIFMQRILAGLAPTIFGGGAAERGGRVPPARGDDRGGCPRRRRARALSAGAARPRLGLAARDLLQLRLPRPALQRVPRPGGMERVRRRPAAPGARRPSGHGRRAHDARARHRGGQPQPPGAVAAGGPAGAGAADARPRARTAAGVPDRLSRLHGAPA